MGNSLRMDLVRCQDCQKYLRWRGNLRCSSCVEKDIQDWLKHIYLEFYEDPVYQPWLAHAHRYLKNRATKYCAKCMEKEIWLHIHSSRGPRWRSIEYFMWDDLSYRLSRENLFRRSEIFRWRR